MVAKYTQDQFNHLYCQVCRNGNHHNRFPIDACYAHLLHWEWQLEYPGPGINADLLTHVPSEANHWQGWETEQLGKCKKTVQLLLCLLMVYILIWPSCTLVSCSRCNKTKQKNGVHLRPSYYRSQEKQHDKTPRRTLRTKPPWNLNNIKSNV